MNQPLNGVAKIPQAHARNLWSWISLAIELVGPWNLRIRVVSYIPNYKTAMSVKITCWEGEQFPLKRSPRIVTCIPFNKFKHPRLNDLLILIFFLCSVCLNSSHKFDPSSKPHVEGEIFVLSWEFYWFKRKRQRLQWLPQSFPYLWEGMYDSI